MRCPSQSQLVLPTKLYVPCDLYGLFVVEPLQLDASIDGWTIVSLAMMRAFVFIALNFSIQVLYVVRIHRMSVDMQDQQWCHEHSCMQVVCVFVFGISICSELRGCADFLLLVVRCPASGSGYAGIGDGPDRPQRHGAVLSQEAVERPGGLRARIANWAKRSSAVDQTRVWTLGSLDHRWKAVCFLFVGVPRVVICCLLANSGARFIVRSPDIIVDTVAVLFVVDVAAFMYSAFTTNAVKQQLEMVQPLECYPCNTRRLVSFLFVNFAYPVLLVCFSVAVVWCSREGCRKSEDFEARPHTMSFMLGSQMFVQQCTTSLDVIQSGRRIQWQSAHPATVPGLWVKSPHGCLLGFLSNANVFQQSQEHQ
ncbi:unnamed protein product [Prorocentrum cordatum]|uniref:Very-long-chain 3-oxoacyl-CoA synthase n=1 Tax=Prorocentrum cordatum TaxID=2364126 RepID=A0ABN9RWB1_9DINO|nr:unnamed protein product [Polarella glacialis]